MTHTTSPTIYDDFASPEPDYSRWYFLEYPPGDDGVSWRCEEPGARTRVGDGTFDIHIERFERAHDQVAIMDNPKHLLLSTRAFALPASGPATFTMELAVTNINAATRDYRDGFASMNVLDMRSGWVFDACTTGDSLFSIYERLPMPGVANPFTYVIEAPLSGVATKQGQSHAHSVTLDAGRGLAQWHVDGTLVYQVHGVEIPTQVNIGFGIFTLHPLHDGRSTSLRGQGLSASFGPVSVSGTE